jgi:helix-turn-helix, Psq domain
MKFAFETTTRFMTRPKSISAKVREDRIKEAIDGVKSGRYKSYRQAAITLDIPRATLTHRASGRLTRIEAHEDEQALSLEETELVRWITRLTTSGYPPKPRFVREMAEAIRT